MEVSTIRLSLRDESTLLNTDPFLFFFLSLFFSKGIFLDFDLQCMRSLKPLQHFEVVAPAAHPMGVSNGFFMAEPNHPFLQRLVDNLPRFNRHWVFLPYPTVMLSTGCYYMSYVYFSSFVKEHND